MTGETPAEQLEGETLKDGWQVVRRLPPSSGASGGSFSVGYEARRGGQRAFLKALDVNAALDESESLHNYLLSGGQWREAELLEQCAADKLSRVIRPYGRGTWRHPTNRAITPVPYIITEWADGGDLTRATIEPELDLEFGLDAVHGIACALQQVHILGIAHRDIRPSNGVVVSGQVKLADFGHAADLANSSVDIGPHGAAHYAPPEVLYNSLRPTDAGLRSADLYLLGSLLVSVVASRAPLTTLWIALVDDEVHPIHNDGPLSLVLPFVRDAYCRALEFVEARIPQSCDSDRIMRVVRMLTDPDPSRRGHPHARAASGDDLALDRIITELDVVRRRVKVVG